MRNQGGVFVSIKVMTHVESQKIPNFRCEYCDYYTFNKKDFNKHCKTKKHLMRLGDATLIQFIDQDDISSQTGGEKWVCECGNKYKYHSGLYRHKRSCTMTVLGAEHIAELCNSPLMEFIKQNQEFKELLLEQTKYMIELAKEGRTINNSLVSNSTINNSFNIQLFLNEKCKNALSMSQFIGSLRLSTQQLEVFRKSGFAEGISSIFVKRLKELTIFERPIHCSDIKREIFYIKNDDHWEKDTLDKDNLTSAIKEVAHKNIMQISEWVKEHPHCNEYDHADNDAYMGILCGSMSGGTEEEQEENISKIIKNIAKEVVIDKKNI